VRACIHRGECSYVYEYLRLYCVTYCKKKIWGVVLVGQIAEGRSILVLLQFGILGAVVVNVHAVLLTLYQACNCSHTSQSLASLNRLGVYFHGT
jgi:hypothetical protein